MSNTRSYKDTVCVACSRETNFHGHTVGGDHYCCGCFQYVESNRHLVPRSEFLGMEYGLHMVNAMVDAWLEKQRVEVS